MTEMSQVKRLIRDYSEIKIGDTALKVKPIPKDAEMVLVAIGSSKGKMTEADASKLTDVMRKIIKRANPDMKEEEIDSIIASNYGKLMEELLVLFGFASRDLVEQLRKNTKGTGLEG